MLATGLLTTLATNAVRPELYANLILRPWTWLLALMIAVSVFGLPIAHRKGSELFTFIASAGTLIGLLAATAAGLYPVLLLSTTNAAYSLTVYNSANSQHGLQIGLIWWSTALAIAVVYFVFLFRSFKGKVNLGDNVYHE